MKLTVIGCGFMGGSFAAALRRRGLASRIVGFDRSADTCEKAVRLGLLDAGAASAAQAVAGSDLVMLAAPVGAMADLLRQIAAVLPASAVVTDLGSTKADVAAAARQALGAAFERFVPGHPIAGSERFGPEHADPDLFHGRVVITTPAPDTSATALDRVETLWRACGARIERMDALQHDRVLASVSHLPHVLAFALVAQIAAQPDAQLKFSLAGAGFRDFTRIAASSAAMWRDIALANRDALVPELAAYRELIGQIERALQAGDSAWIESLFENAGRARRSVTGDGRDG
jgi:prephenate dehydrogenase